MFYYSINHQMIIILSIEISKYFQVSDYNIIYNFLKYSHYNKLLILSYFSKNNGFRSMFKITTYEIIL